jgi:hypothetical protein
MRRVESGRIPPPAAQGDEQTRHILIDLQA